MPLPISLNRSNMESRIANRGLCRHGPALRQDRARPRDPGARTNRIEQGELTKAPPVALTVQQRVDLLSRLPEKLCSTLISAMS